MALFAVSRWAQTIADYRSSVMATIVQVDTKTSTVGSVGLNLHTTDPRVKILRVNLTKKTTYTPHMLG